MCNNTYNPNPTSISRAWFLFLALGASMADSTCLMRHPFSYTPAFPNEAMEGNHPIHDALGQSVSFGRFMSESLAWEKWSTFSHNRYVEEAEKFARPGSVAQKKAFFEAHYKKIAAHRAAVFLEQANASKSLEETETKQNVYDDDVACCSDPKEEKIGSREVERPDSAIAHQVFDEISQKVESVDFNDGFAENEFNRTPQMDKSLPKSSCQNLEQPSTISKKKAATLSSKLPLFNRSSNSPSAHAKPIAPASCLSNATPKQVANRYVMESADRRKSNNITPKQAADKYVMESANRKISSNATPKQVANKYVVEFADIRKSNNATPKQVADKYVMESADKRKSINATPKQVADKYVMESADRRKSNNVSPKQVADKYVMESANRRKSNNATPKHDADKYVMESADRRKSNNATPRQVANKYAMESADERKSTPKSLRMASFTPIRELNKLTSTGIRNIERSRVGSSTSKPAKDGSTPLRTPNTALKNESQMHPSATPWSEKKRNKSYSLFSFTPFSLRTDEKAARRKEDKAETEITKLRQSFCFKARSLPNFYKERKAQKNEEVPKSHPPTPKLGRKTNPKTGEATMPHSSHSSRNMNKNVQGKARSLSLQTLMSAHENVS